MLLNDMDRVVFAGDSVTDAQRAFPLGEGLHDRVGFGYVRMVENLLAAWHPEISVRITNAGVNGNTSRELLSRYETDVLALSPDYVSLCIGVNDVWRQFDCPAMPDMAVEPEEYQENLLTMVRGAKRVCKGVILCAPYYMEPNQEDPIRRRMNEYAGICRQLAAREGCLLVDFQRVFDSYSSFYHSAFLAWDRVHPNQKGATLMAREWLEVCGVDFSHRWESFA